MVLGGRPKVHALPQARVRGNYRKLDVVGTGAYGEVFKVQDQATGIIYVVKEAKLIDGDTSFANEIATLLKLDHPHIVRIHDYGMENGKIAIYLEFVSGGSLYDMIQSQAQPMPENLIREYVRQILLALV
jgi:serine/threonine protein kinase